MKIAVTGSIATDYLMTFAGRFADLLIPEELHRLSLSFLVDELTVRRGGVAGNIAYGLAQLGQQPVLVSAVGPDFDDYRAWLDRHGVDTVSVRVSDQHYTARFFCTTDLDQCQVASFYTGAMAEARDIELAPVVARVGGVDLVVVSPNDPAGMVRHTDEARALGIPFVADPGQQLALIDAGQIEALVTGAAYLLANDYEVALIRSKTGWSHDELVGRAAVCVTTLGAEGCRIERAGQPPIAVPAAPVEAVADPTGVGDAFRAGFLAGLGWGLNLAPAARVGAVVASMVLETVGTQEYEVDPPAFARRLLDAYRDEDTAAAVTRTVPPRPVAGRPG
jgi:adenosine kinase